MATRIERLIEVMARLRDPDGGCPWDIEQDFRSIAPYTIEEAYEVAEAIDRDDMAALRDELGDLLLQVVFHARMAEERGDFGFADIVAAIVDKMVRRHPHVFGDETVDSAAAQTQAWEAHKAVERAARAAAEGRPASLLDGVSVALPGLTRAVKLGRRAARVGFDWPDAPSVLGKIDEELAELGAEMAEGAEPSRLEDELGDLLFSVANLARHLGIEPEAAVRRANRKFEDRFRSVEERLREAGRPMGEASQDEMERLWDEAKAEAAPQRR